MVADGAGSSSVAPKAKAGAKAKAGSKRVREAGADATPSNKLTGGRLVDPKKVMAKDLVDFAKEFNQTTGSAKNLLSTIKQDKSWQWEKDHNLQVGLDSALTQCDRVNEEPFMAALLSLDGKEFLSQYGEKNFKAI